jgi:hypothetical protein
LARAIIDSGLYDLQPEFKEFENYGLMQNPPWANEVIHPRENYYPRVAEWQQISRAELWAVIDIVKLFGADTIRCRGGCQCSMRSVWQCTASGIS